MEEGYSCDSCNVFMIGMEFVYFYLYFDYSMYLGLLKEDVVRIIDKGWGEWYLLIKRGFLFFNIIMMYVLRM